MPRPDYPPELEFQMRMAMDVPEPDADTMDALREQFIARGVARLKPDSGAASASRPFRPEREPNMKRTSSRFSPRLAWGMALAAIAILIALALSSPTVVNALRRLLRYVPGVGFVERDASLRILEGSITIENENISLTIEQVVAGPDKMVIVFHYFVPPKDPSAYQVPMDPNPGNPALLLPDGSRVEARFGRRMAGDGLPVEKGAPIRYSMEFPPLPAGVMGATLELSYLPAIPPGAGPKDWRIPLKLIPAPEGFVTPVFTVEENGADSESATGIAPSHEPTSGDTNALHGITASLDLYIPLEDGYLLIGSMQWSETDYPANAIKPLDYIEVTDATGEEIHFEPVLGPVPEKPQDEEYRSYWALKILEKDLPPPLKITIDSADVNMYAHPYTFQFDPGPNPISGQSWDINQDFQIGDIQVRILKTSLTTMGSPDLVFEFEVWAQPNELADVYIGMEIDQCMGGGGSIPTEPSEVIQSYVHTCRTDLPSGPLEVQVTGAVIWGPWQVEWAPPETSSVAPPTPIATPLAHPEACISRESWRQALEKNDPILSGLTGKLVLADPSGEVSIANITGEEQKMIGSGGAPSLSPAGSRVAMIGPMIDSQPPNGLYIMDLVSGNTTLLPGTASGDSAPLWSPDGTMVAFTRSPAGPIGAPGPYNIMVMNADGSDLRQLTFGDATNLATAWMPDSAHIVYTVRHGLKSASVRMVDITTGESSQLFETSYGYGSVVISPDGKRAAFEDWLPGEIYALFVSNLDSSNRKLLAQGNELVVTVPMWSPDSQWIIACVHSDNPNEIPNPRLALIHVDTCQFVPLPYLSGYVGSWLP